MARSVPWRRSISDAASWHQDEALNATIYILRQTGPTGFLLKEEGESNKFKVLLGDPHKCTCSVFAKEKDLCKHICWVLLKKFRVPRQNPVTWQLGLVEREINEILRGILTRQEAQATQPVRKYTNGATGLGHDPGSANSVIEQRPISEEDVCPICQDELLAKHLPVTYCKFGCGNNVHIKCMKVWADHQKSSGKTVIECPFCREDFGPISLLQQEMKNSSERETRAERLNEHLGTTCRKCHVCPIKGKCYRCSVCVDFHLCQACFNTSVHMEHNFLFRQKSTQRWRPTPNRSQGGLLPDAIVNNLMTREISDQDYDLLLQLDSQSAAQPSDLTETTIQSFPMERVRVGGPMLAPGMQCRICLHGYEIGQFVRRLPCRHKYHRECIDNWLLHRHPTCPIDGTIFTNESVRLMREANRERLKQLQQNSSTQRDNRSVNQVSRYGNTTPFTNDSPNLEIPGIGIARLAAQQTNPAHQDGDRNASTVVDKRPTSQVFNNFKRKLITKKKSSLSGLAGAAIGQDNDVIGHSLSHVIGVNFEQQANQTPEEEVINVIAATNQRHSAADGHVSELLRGAEPGSFTGQLEAASNVSHCPSASSRGSSSTSGRRHSNLGLFEDLTSFQDPELTFSNLMANGTNVNGQGTSKKQDNHQSSNEQTETGHFPSIPVQRQTKGISLGIGETVNRKPPSGGGDQNQRRIRSKGLHCERTLSQEYQRQENNVDSLYIGHNPAGRLGFNSEFLLSATESRSSKSLRTAKSKQDSKSREAPANRKPTITNTEIIDDMALCGSALTSLNSKEQSE